MYYISQEQYNGQYGKEAEIYHKYSCSTIMINSNYTNALFPQKQYNRQYGKEAEIYLKYSCRTIIDK